VRIVPIRHSFGVGGRVDAEWIKSPAARRTFMHWADRRPAWLWSHDGMQLIWRNSAARFVNARLKKTGLRLPPEAVPIRGQVARLIRLGSLGRSSLSRVQLLSGDKPASITCSCTPLPLPDGNTALLLVGIDPVAPDIIAAAGGLVDDQVTTRLLPEGAQYLIVREKTVLGGSPAALESHAAEIESAGAPEESEGLARLPASGDGAELVVYLSRAIEAPLSIEDVRHEEGVGSDEISETRGDDLAHQPEPLLPLGIEPIETPPDDRSPAADEWVAPLPPPPPDRSLSSLFDRLAEDASLYSTLTAADETFHPPPGPDESIPESPATPEIGSESPPETESAPPPDADMVGAIIEYADDPEVPPAPSQGSPSLWMITGRGFRALEPRPIRHEDDAPSAGAPTNDSPPPSESQSSAPPAPPSPAQEAPPHDVATESPAAPQPKAAPDVATVDEAPDAETAERVSRYNFEELGRILTDRVAGEGTARIEPEVPIAPRSAAPVGVINLHAETLVLNRLPLAIMVFRDQQVLFANRALTDLLGHDSVESLRAAGLGSIFPSDEAAAAGPVNRLLRRDGSTLPVTARLQSVTWQGRAALMLSASTTAPPRNHEAAVRTFAEAAADLRDEGFLVADRAGAIVELSARAAALLGRATDELLGKPLATIVGRAGVEPLRKFLEQPARFPETARPALRAATENGGAELALFAAGQSGVVTGYFGLLRQRAGVTPPAAPLGDDDIEPSMLARLSRGIRRPLNTVIGFADLLRSTAHAGLDRERTLEYARDIRTAGLEIAVLVDELDDFARLREGHYTARPSDVDLAALLDSCVMRVRNQAAAARVLVRSAVSEVLPRIHADRASLAQALLNLLASAIDQTPIGGSVILSAQTDEEGNVAIHVRDGANSEQDLGDRFVVFRDGVDKDGEALGPVRSSVGLALTRSLLAVNACSLSVDPTVGPGTLFSLLIPAGLVVPS
jgi:signal transduction histidine kinase